MKVSHEVPRCLLEHSRNFNDYDYCLPHLLDQDEEYKEFFYESKRQGRYIVMDNSLHELGHAYDHERLLYWVNELEPNEFMVPDVWMDHLATVKNAKHWLQYSYPENTTLVAVVQASTPGEARVCYTELRDLGYRKIAFSYGADWYADLVNHPNKDLSKSLGRIQFMSSMYKRGYIGKSDRIHLLGCSVPQEFGWYKDMPNIESIDTSNPVMSALEGVEYASNGLQSKPKANMNDHFDVKLEDVNLNLLARNIIKFRGINNIPSDKIWIP